MKNKILIFIMLMINVLNVATAQNSKISKLDEKYFKSLKWRNVGAFRGGRSCAVTGVAGKPNLFYMGAAGGGVWKTTDAGKTWGNISDGFFGGSIGCVSVSEKDNNVIYVGTGEETVRGNVSSGNGLWKSDDAGRNWKYLGLKETRHISRIRIHPQNPDIVYVASMGDLYKSNDARGIYRSKDGGKTFDKILFVNGDVGAVDLVFDPQNPRVLFASMWRARRTPYSFSSGGDGSGLWKSIDGGDNWTDISRNEGLPKGTLGISGVAVSFTNSDKIYAIIEAEDGGVFRSEDGGKTWQKTNSDRDLRQRAWYYSRIYCDTKDENTLYIMNVSYGKSIDGGKTFKYANAQHGDHHDLWIAPEDNKRLIIADDGGAQVSLDGAATWSSYYNQPTGQYYRVVTDNAFPYKIYVAQQDNSTIRIKHRSENSGISQEDWEPTAGGESAHIAPDPLNPDIVYGGSYGGYLTRRDHKTGSERAINVWPDNPIGAGAEAMKYRFQWNYPIFFSPHNPKKLYACSNFLHVSTNEGEKWDIISGDLTRNDLKKQLSSGGPITQDNTAVEYYCTIFAAAESPKKEGVIWTGSDDGLVQLTKDGGKNWQNVTPKGMPDWIMINSIEPDPTNEAACYLAATNYKNGDYRPYLYKTKDFGATWTKIVNGIADENFTRVIRCDLKKQGLLYAGTEGGMYISTDDGGNWQSFQLNLPIVPITDLTIKNENLIAATQGRSLWMIDDLGVIESQMDISKSEKVIFYQPSTAFRLGGSQDKPSKTAGTNHAPGITTHFYIENPIDTMTVKMTFSDAKGNVIRTFSNKAKEEKDKIEAKQGSNEFSWNLKTYDGEKFDGMLLWDADVTGPMCVPGVYNVNLSVGKENVEKQVLVKADENNKAITQADFVAQYTFVKEALDKASEAHKTIGQIRDIRKQMKSYIDRLEDTSKYKILITKQKRIDSLMTKVEETLYQTKLQSQQDMLNFPIRLTNKLLHVKDQVLNSDFRPTQQAIGVKDEMIGLINKQLDAYKTILTKEIPEFNALVKAQEIDAIFIKK